MHEARRMKARLTAQDRVISSLSDYTAGQVTERLAQAIHGTRSGAADPAGVTARSLAAGCRNPAGAGSHGRPGL